MKYRYEKWPLRLVVKMSDNLKKEYGVAVNMCKNPIASWMLSENLWLLTLGRSIGFEFHLQTLISVINHVNASIIATTLLYITYDIVGHKLSKLSKSFVSPVAKSRLVNKDIILAALKARIKIASKTR